MSKANKTIKLMVYIALYTALAIVLDYVKEMLPFLNMPQGGSINIALLPVVLASFHLGAGYGMVTGAIWMLVSFLVVEPPFAAEHNVILGYLCDYVIPSIVIGAASFLFRNKNYIMMELGILITMVIRTVSILISGALCWPGDAASGSVAAWAGSIGYNLPYCIATTVLLLILIPILYKVFEKQFERTR